jgi:hypothetical protein
VKQLANELFYFVKTLERSSLKTMFRKYELQSYLGVVSVLQKIQMPNTASHGTGVTAGSGQNASQPQFKQVTTAEQSTAEPQELALPQ